MESGCGRVVGNSCSFAASEQIPSSLFSLRKKRIVKRTSCRSCAAIIVQRPKPNIVLADSNWQQKRNMLLSVSILTSVPVFKGKTA